MIMFRNLHSKLWTKQLLKRIQISRTAPTTLSCLAMSVCPTTSATTAPSSLTVLVLLTPMYRLVWLHGVLAVGRMEPQECTPLLARLCAGFLRLRFKDSSNALLPGKLHQPHWLTSLLLKESQRLIMELLTLRLTKQMPML